MDESDLARLLKQIFPRDSAPGLCSAIVLQTAEAELGLRQEVRASLDFIHEACNARSRACSLQVIETVLSYLVSGEGMVDQAPMVSPLPEMNATLQLAFHKSDPQELASTNALVDHVLKMGKERQGKHIVSIPALAHQLGVSFSVLQERLRELAEAGEVSYTSSDRALCLQVCVAHRSAVAVTANDSSRRLDSARTGRCVRARRSPCSSATCCRGVPGWQAGLHL